MSASDFKVWMEKTGKNVTDIAHELQIHPNTVYAYLNGKPVRRSTRSALERLASASAKEQAPGGKVAAG